MKEKVGEGKLAFVHSSEEKINPSLSKSEKVDWDCRRTIPHRDAKKVQ
jgi:hypothetical protein